MSPEPSAEDVCPIHYERFREFRVRIEYGLPAPPPTKGPEAEYLARYEETFSSLFPHTTPEVAGGCIVSDDSPKTTTVFACPRCVAAEKEWTAGHWRR